MEIEANQSAQKQEFQPHPDYYSNRKWSAVWIRENEPDMPNGIRVIVDCNERNFKDLLCFLFTPPRDWYGCGFASVVSMQQSQGIFFEKVHQTYARFKRYLNKEYYTSLINYN